MMKTTLVTGFLGHISHLLTNWRRESDLSESTSSGTLNWRKMTNEEHQYIFGCRWANRRDHEAISDIVRRYGNREFNTESVHKLLRAKYRELIVVCLEGVEIDSPLVVGFLMYYRGKEGVHVEYLMVHPEWTRCGVGRTLAGWLSNERLPVYAVTHDYGLATFYTRCGWAFEGDGEHGLKFVRKPS